MTPRVDVPPATAEEREDDVCSEAGAWLTTLFCLGVGVALIATFGPLLALWAIDLVGRW